MGSISESPLVRKIRALRNKAKGTDNEHEATAFMQKALEMLATAGLTEGDVEDKLQQEEVVSGQRHRGKWDASESRKRLLRAVCRFYMCEAVAPGRGDTHWTIVGKPSSVMVALSMFDYLLATTLRMSNAYGRANIGSNVVDWRKGCMGRLSERLYEMIRAATAEKQERRSDGNPGNLPALRADEKQLIENHMKAMGVVYNKAAKIKTGNDAALGRAAAEGIGLHPQVGTGGGGRLAIGRR